MKRPTTYNLQPTISRGYTLVELIVAVGLFAIVMMIASGAYLIMISASREAQGITTGIDNLSYALETMTRNIRTGSIYNCGNTGSGTSDGNNSTSFAFTDINKVRTIYSLNGGTSLNMSTDGGTTWIPLTDQAVTILSSGLAFRCTGTTRGDPNQAQVTIVISGSVNVGPGKTPEPFNVETGATMRGTDL